MTTVVRLGSFVRTRFTPPIYVTYGVLWTLAFEATAVPTWHPDWTTAARASAVVLALLFLRMVDEIKDLAHDRIHHPDRPLVTGAITVPELRTALVALAVAGTALSAWVSRPSAILYLATLAYGLALIPLENRYPKARDGLLLSLAVTYPVQVLLGLHLAAGLPLSPARTVALLVMFAGVFLHFEFARKTTWRAGPGERLYSAVLGPRGSAAASLAWAVIAAAALWTMVPPWSGTLAWLPYTALLAPVTGMLLFLTAAPKPWPVPYAMLFVLWFDATLIVRAAL